MQVVRVGNKVYVKFDLLMDKPYILIDLYVINVNVM